MIATGGTLVESIRALHAAGASDASWVAATHGLLLGDALGRLLDAGVQALLVTDTVARPAGEPEAVRVVSVAPLLATAIRRQLADDSLGDLY
jgi:ribose-phosphate pyrophosphokinase